MVAELDWPIVRLSKLAEFRNGVNYNKNSFGEGVKVVGVSNFKDFTKPKYAELEQINGEGIVTDRNILRDGDIVFVRSNGNRELIGRSLFIEKPPEEVTHSAFTIRLRFTSEAVHPKFYAYCFRTPLIRQALTAQGNGTNINNLNQDILNALEVPVPPLPTQQRIAGILSAYDELIENSQRRIKILESMARTLYREWFLHFRFPGSENHPRVASALGEIPHGWDVRKLGDLVEFKKGKKPAYVFESEEVGLKRHLLIDALRGGSSREFVAPDKLISTTSDDTIMVMDGSGSSDVFIGHEGVIGSTLGRYRIQVDVHIGPFWLFLFFSNHLAEIKSKNVGSAIPHANKDFINGMNVVIGPEDVMQAFEKAVEPMFGLIRSLNDKVNTLRNSRDLLLPRLLSGQINVDAAP
jgi:type I restriction enzyme S subunit